MICVCMFVSPNYLVKGCVAIFPYKYQFSDNVVWQGLIPGEGHGQDCQFKVKKQKRLKLIKSGLFFFHPIWSPQCKFHKYFVSDFKIYNLTVCAFWSGKIYHNVSLKFIVSLPKQQIFWSRVKTKTLLQPIHQLKKEPNAQSV